MNTFLKILLCVAAAVIALKLMPFLLVQIMAGGFAILVAASLVLAGVLAFAGVGIALLVALAISVIALSPLWIPVLVVVGLVALICRLARAS